LGKVLFVKIASSEEETDISQKRPTAKQTRKKSLRREAKRVHPRGMQNQTKENRKF
jgi:hypothetical protein